ncbi:MAG TPA: hypothetical protein VJU18_12445 [Vicinamibacteria bacterium]|nr:hypothetical protein [Vicinamibacteria bacterium]
MALSMLLLAAAIVSPQAPPEKMAVQPAAEQVQPAAPASTAPAEGRLAAGLLAYKRRQLARAEASFREAVDADPGSAAAHFYLGYVVYKRTEPKRPFHPDKQKAAELFARAFELDPAFRPSWK